MRLSHLVRKLITAVNDEEAAGTEVKVFLTAQCVSQPDLSKPPAAHNETMQISEVNAPQ